MVGFFSLKSANLGDQRATGEAIIRSRTVEDGTLAAASSGDTR